MSIKKRVIISNILMLLVPIVAAVLLFEVGFDSRRGQYWESFEEILDDDNAIVTAEGILYAYKNNLLEDIGSYSTYEALAKELGKIGYHYEAITNGVEVYSNITESEYIKLDTLLQGIPETMNKVTLNDNEIAIIRETFEAGKEKLVLTAMIDLEMAKPRDHRTLLTYRIIKIVVLVIVSLLVIVVITNISLAAWITNMILKPMNQLVIGAKEIGKGNLDYTIQYYRDDEFGEVCTEFDRMREQLKGSVETRLKYEQYRNELIAGISHDLRTPLTSIRGYVEGLQDGLANTPEKQQRYYGAIRTRTSDMEALVENLSTFSRLETKEHRFMVKPVRITEVINEFLEEYDQEAEKARIHIETRFDLQEETVLLDVVEMKRVFTNLFVNSVKYRVKEESNISITITNELRKIKIIINDDGPGVREEELEHIFVSFYRGDASRHQPGLGNGLGLAIVKEIVEGHMGTIYAKNENGLAIVIELPIYKEEKE